MVICCGSGNEIVIRCSLSRPEGVDFPSLAVFRIIMMRIDQTTDPLQVAVALALC
jgi:hypothetical protein